MGIKQGKNQKANVGLLVFLRSLRWDFAECRNRIAEHFRF
ncbi:hypothetical protein BS732_1298 [Bacillus subtilis MB73/2]|nr:hypothetical protein BS732_1298 [Bacillus subtilis MB73/2]